MAPDPLPPKMLLSPRPGLTREDGATVPATGHDATIEGAGSEVLDDGQEEVFAYSAVERGLVADPKALGPEDLARAPVSPGRLTDR